MDTTLIKEIFEVCIIPLLGVLTAYFVKWVNAKSAELSASRENELEREYLYTDKQYAVVPNVIGMEVKDAIKELKKFSSFFIISFKRPSSGRPHNNCLNGGAA